MQAQNRIDITTFYFKAKKVSYFLGRYRSKICKFMDYRYSKSLNWPWEALSQLLYAHGWAQFYLRSEILETFSKF